MEKLWERIDDIQIVNWIGNFLEKRTQKVRVGSGTLKETEVTSGVTQGSVVGPLLFDIFIDDMSDGVESKIRLFADDCVIYRKIMDDTDEQILQKDLNVIGDWVHRNKMSLNVNKCKTMNFGGKKEHNYEMQGKKLDRVDTYKYLGVVLKNDLGWKEQVAIITKKGINSMNFIMRQLKGMSIQIKEKAYLTMIRPMMEYAAAVWDPYRIGEIKDIEKVQRMAARRVTGRMRRRKKVINDKGELKEVLERPSLIVKELGWKKLEWRRKADRLCSFFRVLKGRGGWKELHTKIRMESLRYGCRGSHERKVVVKGARKDIGKYSFMNRTGREWNLLEKNIFEKEEMDVKEFRRKIEEIEE
jgi:ribonucleases P/MRP protein subunit RPP40